MEVTISIKATPAEFGLVRGALESHAATMIRIIDDPATSAGDKRAARARLEQINDLQEKLR